MIKNKLARELSTLLLGFGGAQLLTLLLLPIITRVYGPESFGEYSALLSILTILGYLGGLRYNLKLQIEKVNNNSVLSRCYLISIITSSIFFVGFYYYFQSIVTALACTILCLMLALYEFKIDYYSGVSKYKIISNANLTRVILTCCLQLCLFWYEYGLVFGLASALMLTLIFKLDILSLDNITLKRIRKKDINFMARNTASSLALSLGMNMPILLVFFFSQSEIAAKFALSDKLLAVGYIIANNIIGRIIYNQFKTSEKPKDVLIKCFTLCLFLSLILTFFVFNFSSQFINIIFGNQWAEVSSYIVALLPWIITQILLIPVIAYFHFIGLSQQVLTLEVLKNGARLLTLVILLFVSLDVYYSVLISSILSMVVSTIFVIGVFDENNHFYKKQKSNFARN